MRRWISQTNHFNKNNADVRQGEPEPASFYKNKKKVFLHSERILVDLESLSRLLVLQNYVKLALSKCFL